MRRRQQRAPRRRPSLDVIDYDPAYDLEHDPYCTNVLTVAELAAELGISEAAADALMGHEISCLMLADGTPVVRRASVVAYLKRSQVA